MSNLPSYDQDLLSRLNALKKSSITLEADEAPIPIPKTRSTPETDLASRLRSLRDGAGTSPSPSPSPSQNLEGDVSAGNTSKASVVRAPRASGVHLETSSRFTKEDIQPFITKIDPSPDVVPQPVDESEIHSLLTEARNVLRQGTLREVGVSKPSKTPIESTKTPRKSLSQGVVAGVSDSDAESGDEDEDDTKEAESHEAEKIIAQLLDELELEHQNAPEPQLEPESAMTSTKGNNKGNDDTKDTTNAVTSPNEHEQEPPHLNLPGVPIKDLTPSSSSAFDKSIAARMAALRRTSPNDLGLPSAPTSAVGKASSSSSGPSVAPTLQTWCVICSADATVVCYGCAGDGDEGGGLLYCARCWREGHLASGVGWEERGHEWARWRSR